MELHFDVAGNAFSISVSTAGTCPALTIATLHFDGPPPPLTSAQWVAYSDAKRQALDSLATVLGIYPQLAEPKLPTGWPSRAQRAAAAAIST